MRRAALFTLIISALSTTAFALTWNSSGHVWNTSRFLVPGETLAEMSVDYRSYSESLSSSGSAQVLGAHSAQRTSVGATKATKTYSVNVDQMRFTPVWSYGLTRNWNLAARLSITRITANIDSQIKGDTRVASEELRPAFHVEGKSGRYFQLSHTEERNRVGAFELRSKHRVYQRSRQALLLFETLKLPTAETEDMDYLLYTEIPPQSVAASIGGRALTPISSRTKLSLSSELTYNFKDKVYARNSDGFLTDEKINRQPGEEVTTELAAQMQPSKPVGVNLGYRYQYQGESEYRDSIKDLQDSYDQEKSAVFLALAWRSQPARYAENGDFAAHFEYENLIDGKNIENANTLSVGVSSRF